MNTQKVKLTTEQINEQYKIAAGYFDLIQIELRYKDLINLEKVEKYIKAYKKHCFLIENPYIEMPVF